MSIMTVKDLKKNAPKGEFLAYINKEEAAALKRAGGSGHLVNGIPSFVGSDYSGKGNANTSGYQGGMRGKGGYQGSTGETNKTKSEGGSGTGNFTNAQAATDKTNKKIAIKEDIAKRELEKLNYAPKSVFEKIGIYNNKYKQKMIQKAIRRNKYANLKELEALKQKSRFGIFGTAIDAFDVDPETDLFDTESPREIAAQLSKTKTGITATQSKAIGHLQKDIAMENTKNISQNDFNEYMNRNKKTVTNDDDPGGVQPLIPIDYNTGAATVEAVEPYNQFTYNEDAFGLGGDSADVTRASYNFNEGGRAGGGIMGTRARRAFGGIMDRVTGRKAYGLGSIFKSAKKAVSGVAKAAKKVLKSDIGKAALLYAGGTYLGGTAMFGGGTGGAGTFMQRLANPRLLGNLLKNSNNTGLFNLASRAGSSLFGEDSILKKTGESMIGKKTDTFADNALRFAKYGTGAYLLGKTKLGEAPPNELDLMTARVNNKLVDPITNKKSDPAAMTATLNEALDNAGGDPDKIAAINKAYRFLNDPRLGDDGAKSVLVANGGRIRRAEGGLMNLGGMEKDFLPVRGSTNLLFA